MDNAVDRVEDRVVDNAVDKVEDRVVALTVEKTVAERADKWHKVVEMVEEMERVVDTYYKVVGEERVEEMERVADNMHTEAAVEVVADED